MRRKRKKREVFIRDGIAKELITLSPEDSWQGVWFQKDYKSNNTHRMASDTKAKRGKPMPRAAARIFQHQADFIKSEAKKSKGEFTEGDIHRQLLDEAINSRKNKKNGQ